KLGKARQRQTSTWRSHGATSRQERPGAVTGTLSTHAFGWGMEREQDSIMAGDRLAWFPRRRIWVTTVGREIRSVVCVRAQRNESGSRLLPLAARTRERCESPNVIRQRM